MKLTKEERAVVEKYLKARMDELSCQYNATYNYNYGTKKDLARRYQALNRELTEVTRHSHVR